MVDSRLSREKDGHALSGLPRLPISSRKRALYWVWETKRRISLHLLASKVLDLALRILWSVG